MFFSLPQILHYAYYRSTLWHIKREDFCIGHVWLYGLSVEQYRKL